MKRWCDKRLKILSKRIQEIFLYQPQLVKLARNIRWLFLEQGIRLSVSLILGIWIARYLGPRDFGTYSYVISFVGLFNAISVLGLNQIIVRELVAKKSQAFAILGTAFVLQFLGGVIAFAIAVGTIYILSPDDKVVRIFVGIVAFGLLFQPRQVVKYWFESQLESRFTIRAETGVFLSISLIKLSMIFFNAPLTVFVWLILVETIVATLALIYVFISNYETASRLSFHVSRAKELLRQSGPLILTGMSISIAMRIDQVMLGEITSNLEVGYYSIGVRLAEPLGFIGIIVSKSFFPRFVAAENKQFDFEFIQVLRYTFYLILTCSILIFLFSPTIVGLLFGDDYAASAGVLGILILSIPVTFINISSTQYLMKYGFHNEILFRQIGLLVINVILNLLLIEKFGIVGAALATLLADFSITFLFEIGRPKFKHLLSLKARSLLFVDTGA